MSESRQPPRVDTQSLTDAGTQIYESVATLEFAGQPATRDALASASPLTAAELDRTLADLTERGLLTTTGAGSQTVYRPARRDWSTRPQTGPGHSLS